MTAKESRADKQTRRLARQFAALSQDIPVSRRIIHSLLHGPLRWARIPIGVLLVAGGLASALPVLGVWMLPLGLLILAVDVPFLRPAITAAVIRGRNGIRRIRRRFR